MTRVNHFNWITVEQARSMYESIGLCYECGRQKSECTCAAQHDAACAKVDELLGDEPVKTTELEDTAEIFENSCTCNGTEAVACLYCREQAKTKEIPF